MKDVRFYLEYDTPAKKRSNDHNGNVVAIIPSSVNLDYSVEALGAVFYYPDSPVATTSVSREYLRTQTKRISEAKAREVHPTLFERLDEEA